MDQVSQDHAKQPFVRELSVSLMRGIANNDARAQAQILIEFVRRNVTYIKDPEGTEYLITPSRMLNSYHQYGFMAGDCDDHVMLLNAMLMSVGIPARPVGVKFGQTATFNHVISGINCCGTMWLVDPCAKNGRQAVYHETLIV